MPTDYLGAPAERSGLNRILLQHQEMIRFLVVGAVTFVIDLGIYYSLKLVVLQEKPLTAKCVSGVIAVIASYVLNREWSFNTRGGRTRHVEAALFFTVSAFGVVVSFLPLGVSRYLLLLDREHVGLAAENIADFVSAYILGNLLQVTFRFWGLRRWVFLEAQNRADE